MAEVQVATVRNQVMLSLRDDFENDSIFKPREFHEKSGRRSTRSLRGVAH
jgi:hypothetical protein